ncbi:MAG: peptidoglycan DD-metalloendopeptidase family protein [Xanthobacteraceae bacterium]
MSRVTELRRVWCWPRAAALTLMTISVAACSNESSRFNDDPFRPSSEATGSVGQAQAVPTGAVEARPLPPQAAAVQPLPPTTGTAGGGRGIASYTPNPSPARLRPAGNAEVTGSLVAAPKPGPSGHWTWDGGTPVTVANGDTVDAIARRYGVPGSAIIQANNLPSPPTVHAGQQLVIPRYSAAPGAVTRPGLPAHKPAAVPAMSQSGSPGVHVVAPGETLSKIARLYGKRVDEIARANNLAPATRLNVGDRLTIPGVRSAAAGAAGKTAPALAQGKTVTSQTAAAEGETAASASVFTPVDPPASKDAGKSAEATGSLPKLRWPANGRVIAGFGPSTNGQQNDGINIALPENTQVKAAEDGVVAYAGNELKGYGNLVLVRHPNGYVTAYAHAKELLVKRGDQVKRGQVILRSGQTGTVNSPQLHFEVRKGATPMDPTRFLGGA